ncbi:MAG: bifunctional metallophosphatase/5'-nucleotidase [Candidatus Krumholzibacteriota bacterium]|nr:bifunctional metallophosphatase/5'-nucleotidase [Candidatus Krumholzibacteriota bacterium]
MNFSISEKKRTILILSWIWILPWIIPGCGGGNEGEKTAVGETSLTVLFSSDLLGKIRSCGCTVEDTGGLGRRATYTGETRRVAKNLLVLDAGDIFSLDLSFSKIEGELAMECLSVIGLDAFTPGEIDFIFGLPFLQTMAENASFDFVAANLVDPQTDELIFPHPYLVKELNTGFKVGITGVLDESIVFPGYIDRSGFALQPADKTLRKILPRMKKESDFLILLSHLGLEKTKKLLAEIPGFDLAIVGHGKPVIKGEEKVGKTLILATGGQGQYLGRIDLSLLPTGKCTYGRMKLIPLSDDIAIHPEVRTLFRQYDVPLTDKEARGGGH